MHIAYVPVLRWVLYTKKEVLSLVIWANIHPQNWDSWDTSLVDWDDFEIIGTAIKVARRRSTHLLSSPPA